MRPILASLLTIMLAVPALAGEVTEPKSGAKLQDAVDGMPLLGVGLRTKTFLKVKVYAIGLYVADAALQGPLAPYRGSAPTPALYKELIWGDFPKQITLHIVRDLTADQIRGAFRETLGGQARVETLASYFTDVKTGQEIVFRWAPGGTLLTTVGGVAKPSIEDKNFAAALFGVWLGEHPVQDDIKQDLVARLVTPTR
jgi:hypothetical protein